MKKMSGNRGEVMEYNIAKNRGLNSMSHSAEKSSHGIGVESPKGVSNHIFRLVFDQERIMVADTFIRSGTLMVVNPPAQSSGTVGAC